MAEQLTLLAEDYPHSPLAPPDQPARDRVSSDLDSTLFVEAGAGSGKTTALVGRIVALVDTGIELDSIAAITFTEKAARELRQRVREQLVDRSGRPGGARAHRALSKLDGAAICTLHAFAQRLLFEHPIEAGLPPGVEVLDELSSEMDFQERWDQAIPDLLERPELAAAILVADVAGISVRDLRTIALEFEDNWDLVRDRLHRVDPAELTVDVTGLVEALRAVGSHASEALDGEDPLAVRLDEVSQYAASLELIASDTARSPTDRLVDLADALAAPTPRFSTTAGEAFKRLGSKKRWPDEDRFESYKAALFDIGEQRDALRQALTTAAIHQLAGAIGAFVLASADERRRHGRLRFHDLLVMARELLRGAVHGEEVHKALRDRYQRLLIDEFQDTDPIQVELATLLASPHARRDTPWQDLEPDPARLFFVGDPKQSIYRFRRADIAVYLAAQDHFGSGGGRLALTTNFRSTRPVIDWINATFSRLIQFTPESQPAYTALGAAREPVSSGAAVGCLGIKAHEGRLRAAELRRIEATGVASAIVGIVEDGWAVWDREVGERPARLSDIAVLIPARTSLPELERALDDAGIAYRAEAASLVYATPEVRDLLMVARAVCDPTDELSVVAALRTPAFGCGDDDLFKYRRDLVGRWDHQDLPPNLPVDNPVVDSLRWMAELHQRRFWMTAPELLEAIVADRRIFELAICADRHREVWRRIRFVIDQARAWTDSQGGSLHGYLTWARMQASDSARVAETVLPETDTDAVRILTVHASKGLEFPIAVLSGMTTQQQSRRRRVQVMFPPDGTIGYRVGVGNTTPEFDAFVPLDEQLDSHERLRLLYVACTRARDHLVVSMHRCTEGPQTSLAHVLGGTGAGTGVAELSGVRRSAEKAPGILADAPLDRTEWAAARDRALTEASRPMAVAATSLSRAETQHRDPGVSKSAPDLDLPPWRKGRYGTAVGRAVHGVLQTVDLTGKADIGDACATQAAAESVIGSEKTIAALVRSALRTASVRAAARSKHWRELYVATPIGDRVLEGYVDLLYESPDGLIIVDYKTDHWTRPEELDEKAARYGLQGAAYAVALEAATGLTVASAVLLYLRPDGAVERPIPELRALMDEVTAIVDRK